MDKGKTGVEPREKRERGRGRKHDTDPGKTDPSSSLDSTPLDLGAQGAARASLLDALDRRRVGHTGKRELLGKLVHVLGELLEGLGRLAVAFEARDKVLEELAAGLRLGLKADLDGAVQKVGDDAHLGLKHGARRERV